MSGYGYAALNGPPEGVPTLIKALVLLAVVEMSLMIPGTVLPLVVNQATTIWINAWQGCINGICVSSTGCNVYDSLTLYVRGFSIGSICLLFLSMPANYFGGKNLRQLALGFKLGACLGWLFTWTAMAIALRSGFCGGYDLWSMGAEFASGFWLSVIASIILLVEVVPLIFQKVKPPASRGIERVTDISQVLSTTLDAQGIFNQMARRQGKIDIAAAAMISFLTAIMRPADRCSITAFNKKYIPVVNLGDESNCKAMMVYLTAICQNATMLYDAIVLSVLQFLVTADRGRPWLLIVLTDGEDTGSIKSHGEAADALRQFNAGHNNHAFIVGIGNDVKAEVMTHLANTSGSVYIPAEHASALPVLFALIALQVQEGIQVDIAAIQSEGVEAVLARVQRTQRIGFQNVDMLLLVDVSGSMTSR